MPDSDAHAPADTPGGSGQVIQDDQALGAQIHSEVVRLSSALAALFDALPAPIRRASDLSKSLDIEISLAARIFKVACATDAAEAIESLPTLNQVRRVVVRAAGSAPGPAAEHAIGVLDRFEGLMAALGENQRDFESLASMHIPGGVRRVELAHRRTAFRANSHLWGRAVECLSSTIVLFPAQDGDSLDAAYTFGYVNARMLHPRQRFTLSTRTALADDPVSEARRAGPELLPEFSDIGEAAITRTTDEQGVSNTEIRLQGAPPTTPHTIFTRQLLPRFASLREPESCFYRCMTTWPAARMHIEMAAPAGLTDPDRVVLNAFANPKKLEAAYQMDPADQVPLHERPSVFTNVQVPPPLPGIPRAPEIFRSSLRWLGLEGTRFDVYRCDVEFPMLHSIIHMRLHYR